MLKALKRAEEVLKKYKISAAPINVMEIVKGERLFLEQWRFKGRLKEVYLGDCIGVKEGLPCCERRELIAHALGHHFLGDGNHCYYAARDHLYVKEQEQVAQFFAAYLLIPRRLLKKAKNMDISEMADYFCVTESFVKKRLMFDEVKTS